MAKLHESFCTLPVVLSPLMVVNGLICHWHCGDIKHCLPPQCHGGWAQSPLWGVTKLAVKRKHPLIMHCLGTS